MRALECDRSGASPLAARCDASETLTFLLLHAGKAKCVVTTAVARELVGFLWAIACEVMGRPHSTRALS